MKRHFYFILPAFLFLIRGICQTDQKEKPYFITIDFAGGLSYPTGSFSDKSASPNQIGKMVSAGLNFRANVEAIAKNKFGLGMGFQTNVCDVRNPGLAKLIIDHSKKENSVVSFIGESAVLSIRRMYAGVSYYYKLGKRFILHPKLDLSFGAVNYKYHASFSYNLPPPPPGTSSFSTRNTVNYTGGTSGFATVVPEINFKVILVSTPVMDMTVNLGANYTYFLTTITIIEQKNPVFPITETEPTAFAQLRGPVSLVNPFFGLAWIFKNR